MLLGRGGTGSDMGVDGRGRTGTDGRGRWTMCEASGAGTTGWSLVNVMACRSCWCFGYCLRSTCIEVTPQWNRYWYDMARIKKTLPSEQWKTLLCCKLTVKSWSDKQVVQSEAKKWQSIHPDNSRVAKHPKFSHATWDHSHHFRGRTRYCT